MILSDHIIFSLERMPQEEGLGMGRGQVRFEMRTKKENILNLDIPKDITPWVSGDEQREPERKGAFLWNSNFTVFQKVPNARPSRASS